MGGGEVRHIQTGPGRRPDVLSWLDGELGAREGGELVLETAVEGGPRPGLPSS